jgi:hypothetical protein
MEVKYQSQVISVGAVNDASGSVGIALVSWRAGPKMIKGLASFDIQ